LARPEPNNSATDLHGSARIFLTEITRDNRDKSAQIRGRFLFF
jgi:hypothetical protein